MNILLVGEYSRLHNSLKEGLQKLGHNVTIIGTGDGFKNYPVDIKITSTISSNKSLKFFAKIISKLFNYNLVELERYIKYKSIISRLETYDVIQLISERTFKTRPQLEIKLLKAISNKTDRLFILSSGNDYPSVFFAHNNGFKYSILTPLKEHPNYKNKYKFVFAYLSDAHKNVHNFAYDIAKGVIATDMDYHLPLIGHKKYLGLIPNPINIDRLSLPLNPSTDKIHIFHGVNKHNYLKKGNRFFDEALETIEQKYPERVVITRVENIPYDEYITLYNKAHILLDQVYSYDQGYNALEAMAKGKVVFTGAEQEWLDFYDLKENSVAINALPNSQDIIKKLEWLILHPEQIIEISKNARAFIEKEHHYISIAKKYINNWYR